MKIATGRAVVLLTALVMTSAAWLRSPEYDEQYTLFVTAGTPRPAWPEAVFAAGMVRQVQAGQASFAAIARDLRATDVHPPFYFWAVSVWRAVFGPGLFQVRLFSVLCGLLSLRAVGSIARRCAIPAVPAMLLTLGSYGFVYTNVIARGFAPAMALLLYGVVCLLGPPRWPNRAAAGALFGAACCCNYLALFIAMTAAIIGSGEPSTKTSPLGFVTRVTGVLTGRLAILAAAAPFLALDAWFFAAQRGTRAGQFPPFHLSVALFRLMQYQAANLFGGLPLYVPGELRVVVVGLIAVLALGLLLALLRARPTARGPAIRLLLGAAVASPAGLLLLGSVFDNTPIELRYLSFGAPFVALLAALACDPGRRRMPRWTRPLVVMLAAAQLVSIGGLMSAAVTMQPARATAKAAAELATADPDADAVVLLPRGNDGVGIVGAFGIEAPPAMAILLVSPTDPPALLRARIAGYQRVVLALLAQDPSSSASLPLMRAAVAGPDWRRVAIGFNVEAFEPALEGR